jgi:hypothetical protein
MSSEVAKRIQRVGQLIQQKVKEEVQNPLLHDELLMRAYEVQQLADILLKEASAQNERL